jgi:hypothetical protein
MVILKAMASAFPIFFDMNAENYILLSPHIDLIIPIIRIIIIVPHQILAIRISLLTKVSSVRKIGIVESLERVRSFHPSFHGLMALISKYR